MDARSVGAAKKSPVTGLRFSSVVPARITGENRAHDLTPIDLALKLHYLRGVWYFTRQAVGGLTTFNLKKPMFRLLEAYYTVSGRIRRWEQSGRPYIQCNDGGVRIIEGHLEELTLEEWLRLKDSRSDDRHRLMTRDQALGPDLGYSPLVCVQFTWFKCGGLAIGLNWAHVLGDAFSASVFVKTYGRIIAGAVAPPLQPPAAMPAPKSGGKADGNSSPAKDVGPVDDHWKFTGNRRMSSFTFVVAAEQLEHAVSKTHGADPNIFSSFDIISSVIWRSVLKIRKDSGPRMVTVCTSSSSGGENRLPSNADVIFSTVEADLSHNGGVLDVAELASLIAEREAIANQTIERDGGESDVIVYGANLTFVDLERCDLYGMELNGEKAAFATYDVDGVGEEGVVLVLPAAEEYGGTARTVTVTYAEDELEALKSELRRFWDIAV